MPAKLAKEKSKLRIFKNERITPIKDGNIKNSPYTKKHGITKA